MRHWFDTEFIEDGKTIDLISIGIVAEDGREYYAINRECKLQYASSWVWKNVLYPIGLYEPFESINPSDPHCSATTKQSLLAAKTLDVIKNDVLLFLGKDPELWADYGAHDFVLFGQIMSRGDRNTFNPMSDCYPRDLPWYYNEIRQSERELGADLSTLPRPAREHNALEDARWNKKAWEFLIEYKKQYQKQHKKEAV